MWNSISEYVSIQGRNLNNVSILCNYVHLQKLELPYNKIKGVCVSHINKCTVRLVMILITDIENVA